MNLLVNVNDVGVIRLIMQQLVADYTRRRHLRLGVPGAGV